MRENNLVNINVQHVLKPYFDGINHIDFVLIFGSYANNSYTSLSDIDIAIHSKKEIDLLELGTIISDLEDLLSKKVDIVLLNELYKKNPKLAFNICDNHQIILCNEKEKYVDFKTNSLKYYFDTKYMYDMFDTALLNRLEDGTYGQTKAS